MSGVGGFGIYEFGGNGSGCDLMCWVLVVVVNVLFGFGLLR